MSKFTPGTRVAVISGFSDRSHREAFIDKVYKNGNFILKGDSNKKQWKPYWTGDAAKEVGDTSRYATTVEVWDDAFDVLIAKKKAKTEHRRKAYDLSNRIRAMRLEFLSDEDLSALEMIVSQIENKSKSEA